MASSIIADVGLLGAMIRELHKALVKPAEEMAAITWDFYMDRSLRLLGTVAHLCSLTVGSPLWLISEI